MRLILVVLALAGTCTVIAARLPPVPSGTAFRVEFDKAEYVLGENILAHAILTNTGTEPFRASFGGDYQSLGRADRYKITVTDEGGTVLPDPCARRTWIVGGGLGAEPELKPGDEWVDSLPLCSFVHFAEAGRYRVRITHDFGWSAGEKKPPSAEAEIVVRMPGQEEADALVAKAANEKFIFGVFGKRSREQTSFAAFYLPIFLPALRSLAEHGNMKAALAIADIETPEATEALIGLLNSSAVYVSNVAFGSLPQRIVSAYPPDPAFELRLGETVQAARLAFRERCWKPGLAAPLAAQARTWLEQGSAEQREHAIWFLRQVGEARDVAPILKLIQSALFDLPHFDTNDSVDDFPQVCMAGVAALHQLDPKASDLTSEAGLYYRVFAFPGGKVDLPALRTALESKRPLLRQAALRAMPEPLPAEFRAAVRDALGDEHPGVCSAAAQIAAKDKNPSYRPAVIALLATERNLSALRSATQAALAVGARYEAARAWAAQLDDAQRWHKALSELATIVIDRCSGGGDTGADRKTIVALRKRWEAFLAKHERDLRKGRIFHPGESALPENLFAPHLEIQCKNGTSWPPKR